MFHVAIFVRLRQGLLNWQQSVFTWWQQDLCISGLMKGQIQHACSGVLEVDGAVGADAEADQAA